MGRHNHQRRRGRGSDPGPREPYVPVVDMVEDGWVVRHLAGSSSGKTYRCPGCQQEVRPGTAHVVVWPEAGAWAGQASADDRRHWHTPCWSARSRRR
ncbi:hypothetical protein [Cryptosporangium phraense]|nr:hypothetical protein [Cryptosporangium phraense]